MFKKIRVTVIFTLIFSCAYLITNYVAADQQKLPSSIISRNFNTSSLLDEIKNIKTEDKTVTVNSPKPSEPDYTTEPSKPSVETEDIEPEIPEPVAPTPQPSPAPVTQPKPEPVPAPAPQPVPEPTPNPTPAPEPEPQPDPPVLADPAPIANVWINHEAITLVNVERQKAGLTPLTHLATLDNGGKQRAVEIIDTFSHSRPDGSRFITLFSNTGYSMIGENIGMGQRSASAIVNSWMKSEGHKSNMLSSKYTHMTIAQAVDSNGINYWVQILWAGR